MKQIILRTTISISIMSIMLSANGLCDDRFQKPKITDNNTYILCSLEDKGMLFVSTKQLVKGAIIELGGEKFIVKGGPLIKNK